MKKFLESLLFKSFTLNNRKETITSVDETKKYIIKIQLKKNERKLKTLFQEYSTLVFLNEKGCKSCPTAYEYGSLDSGFLPPEFGVKESKLDYIIQEYCENEAGYSLADVLLSLIEQKKLGVYQGDIKPENVRFNSKTGVCVFIDYDQSVNLTDEESQMSNFDFLEFCDRHDKNHFSFGNWLRHFKENNNSIKHYFKDGALDLSYTSVFNLQKTTNSKSGIYHTILHKDVFVVGSRGLETRADLLNHVEFSQSEKVLDVGCNAGLLSMYLQSRGCSVTGVDNDECITIAAKIISNILNLGIEYSQMDLDYIEDLKEYDTIMLFSVFHHTRDPVKNAKKIAKACKRIIIETRLIENGKQPVNGSWVDTTKWAFLNIENLIMFLEKIFEGFKFKSNIGEADKGRYILELVKQ